MTESQTTPKAGPDAAAGSEKNARQALDWTFPESRTSLHIDKLAQGEIGRKMMLGEIEKLFESVRASFEAASIEGLGKRLARAN